ncbi:hypothetical protein DFQ00_101391 [Paenibacillus barcinonensis]|uniref:Uncharacterized protein n=1 Tax=Paenibacillus barcinonensis TaxID=198119 RepID=A0A2V4W224_PAEBA|nr:hypothetical protein DFQ00_101391 [Paenibacillus barcinonensis]
MCCSERDKQKHGADRYSTGRPMLLCVTYYDADIIGIDLPIAVLQLLPDAS